MAAIVVASIVSLPSPLPARAASLTSAVVTAVGKLSSRTVSLPASPFTVTLVSPAGLLQAAIFTTTVSSPPSALSVRFVLFLNEMVSNPSTETSADPPPQDQLHRHRVRRTVTVDDQLSCNRGVDNWSKIVERDVHQLRGVGIHDSPFVGLQAGRVGDVVD